MKSRKRNTPKTTKTAKSSHNPEEEIKMKKVKSVAFNVADNMEYEMFHYAEKQQYFSTYVKRLIQRDMEDGKRVFMEMDKQTREAYAN
jgi:hypothetical protein